MQGGTQRYYNPYNTYTGESLGGAGGAGGGLQGIAKTAQDLIGTVRQGAETVINGAGGPVKTSFMAKGGIVRGNGCCAKPKKCKIR
jgi:hypothetical protein